MDLTFSREEEAFRERVRSFIAEHLPARLKGRTRRDLATKEDYLDWHRTLYRQGWVAPLWPKEYGGTGWSVTERYIFNEECARAETPPLSLRSRSSMSASTMMRTNLGKSTEGSHPRNRRAREASARR